MRLKATILLLIVVGWMGGAISTGAYQSTPGGTFPGEDEIDIDDPRIGGESARDFTRESGDCGSDVCAEESPIVFMPYGCEGRSDNPHKSGTNNTQITGKSYTECKVKIRRVSATNQLWRNHFLYWGKEGTMGNETKRNAQRVRAVAVTACNNDLYLVTASHTLVGNNGKTYFGASGKSAAVTC